MRSTVRRSPGPRGSYRDHVEAVRAASPLQAILAEFYRLDASAGALVCPFHADTRPSLSLDAARGLWHCFGCHLGGDVFTFVQRMDACAFPQALARLERRAGRLPYRPVPRDVEEVVVGRQVCEVTAWAADYCAARWSSRVSLAATLYLQERKIPPRIVEQYRIGWDDGSLVEACPDDWRPILEQAGLVTDGRSPFGPVRRDWLAGRVTLPAFENGQPVFLSGRAIDETEPKYLHQRGREAPLYPSADAITPLRAYVVEGPFDALALLAWGYAETVALQGGTRASAIAKLRRARIVYACLDADAAGLESTVRLASALGPYTVRVVALPAGLDPHDVYLRGEQETFEAAVARAPSAVDYLVGRVDVAAPVGEQAAQTDLVLRVLAAAEPFLAETVLGHSVALRLGWTEEQTRAARKRLGELRTAGRTACPACGTVLRGE